VIYDRILAAKALVDRGKAQLVPDYVRGKAQLVLDYVREYRDQYATIFWVEAGQRKRVDRPGLVSSDPPGCSSSRYRDA
jgi:hypothetical protein